LYHNIKPLFANKPTFIVINKIDIARPEDLSEEEQVKLREISEKDNAQILQLSCQTDEGVIDVKNTVWCPLTNIAYDRLLL